MQRLELCLIFIFILIIPVFSQVENIPADHQVYHFLKNMFIKGALSNYDDIILPLSKSRIVGDLKEIEGKSFLLSDAEKEFLCRMEVKMGVLGDNAVSYLDEFPSRFFGNYKRYNQKHLYIYRDSTVNLNVDFLGDLTYLYADKYKDFSILLNIGGQFYGSYSDWLGFLLEGSNGTQFHNRQVAELDPRVKTSFTFNHTGINFFDYTQGYLRLKKDAVSIELGRERILWGSGYLNRMILSENPPLFDFLRFSIAYKSLSYNFLHGWLVQPFETVYIDTITGSIRQKGSKYLAVSRLGFNPFPELKLGISQMIIYANRPFEAAYLNPFLFWESAQRTLGDMDNSFLAIDSRYKITDGIELSASMIFDDILYSALFKGEFDRVDNRSAWQAGLILTGPIIPSNTTLKIEYIQIRPYTFSHPGLGESLTYTNNSYILGTNLQPNSTSLSAEFSYLLPADWEIGLNYSHTIHGNNYYDGNGNLIKNVGGNIFENYTIYDSDRISLLDGNIEKTDNVSLKIQNEILYGIFLNLRFNSSFTKSDSNSRSEYAIFSQLRFFFR